jgi:hypothetical protein
MGIISPKRQDVPSRALLVFFVLFLSPILLVGILIYLLWGAILYTVIWLTRKECVIFVYSDSPTWKEYIESEILPYIQDRAVILNWSERRKWKNSLAVLAFRYFSGYRAYNPIGLVFYPFQLVKRYPFFEAFKEFKHGNPGKVEETKEEFFKILNIQTHPNKK